MKMKSKILSWIYLHGCLYASFQVIDSSRPTMTPGTSTAAATEDEKSPANQTNTTATSSVLDITADHRHGTTITEMDPRTKSRAANSAGPTSSSATTPATNAFKMSSTGTMLKSRAQTNTTVTIICECPPTAVTSVTAAAQDATTTSTATTVLNTPVTTETSDISLTASATSTTSATMTTEIQNATKSASPATARTSAANLPRNTTAENMSTPTRVANSNERSTATNRSATTLTPDTTAPTSASNASNKNRSTSGFAPNICDYSRRKNARDCNI
ncbi:uncharacterized protein LOC127606187 [Hippocampus zosterae]|uniref:uncharacterized protein LOC127606187 n=1 Tax=Hippocampus zosterae TaxID=109293 RepID=UPI00223CE254|nr:uncharacterized protein LOC127606187 [Hippocampus zosterae]